MPHPLCRQTIKHEVHARVSHKQCVNKKHVAQLMGLSFASILLWHVLKQTRAGRVRHSTCMLRTCLCAFTHASVRARACGGCFGCFADSQSTRPHSAILKAPAAAPAISRQSAASFSAIEVQPAAELGRSTIEAQHRRAISGLHHTSSTHQCTAHKMGFLGARQLDTASCCSLCTCSSSSPTRNRSICAYCCHSRSIASRRCFDRSSCTNECRATPTNPKMVWAFGRHVLGLLS